MTSIKQDFADSDAYYSFADIEYIFQMLFPQPWELWIRSLNCSGLRKAAGGAGHDLEAFAEIERSL